VSHKWRGIFWPAELLPAPQQGPYSMELISYIYCPLITIAVLQTLGSRVRIPLWTLISTCDSLNTSKCIKCNWHSNCTTGPPTDGSSVGLKHIWNVALYSEEKHCKCWQNSYQRTLHLNAVKTDPSRERENWLYSVTMIGVVHHGISAVKPISGVIIYTVVCPLWAAIQNKNTMDFKPWANCE
jgi:hypothetical protein